MKSFLDKVYEANEKKATLVDLFDEKYAKYQGIPLCSWLEEDSKQMTKDLKEIFE